MPASYNITFRSDDLGKTQKQIKKSLAMAGKLITNRMEYYAKERLVTEGAADQPPYSTTASWYSMTQIYGQKTKFSNYAKQIKTKVRGPMVWLPMGYAEYRAVIKGIGLQTLPVTFNLTGEFINSMRFRSESNVKEGYSRSYLTFVHEDRKYGNITNTQLLEILNARGPYPVIGLPYDRIPYIVNEVMDKIRREFPKSNPR